VCWGCSYSGQLGDGSEPTTTTTVSGPGSVVGLEDAEALAVGGRHACALLKAGTVRCWGEGRNGQLGDRVQRQYPSSTGSSVPVDVLESDGTLLTGVTQVTAGEQHTCALKSDHTVWCWGMGAEGQLGDGSFHPGFEGAGSVFEVTRVLDLDDAVQISASGPQTCALRATGRVACWGRAGDGTKTANASDVCGSEGAVQLSAGDNHACAVLASGQAICWGYARRGNLGDGKEYSDFSPVAWTPVTVVGLNDVSEIAAGSRATCATTRTAKVYCWGEGSAGLLGDPALESSNVPVELEAFGQVGR
jgi:alpha-tubulin suppressor-like RCC1 family protein